MKVFFYEGFKGEIKETNYNVGGMDIMGGDFTLRIRINGVTLFNNITQEQVFDMDLDLITETKNKPTIIATESKIDEVPCKLL